MSKARANYRKARAVELVLDGHNYDQIAAELGYANRGTAWRTVQRALHDREVEAVDEYREMELARLDALQAGCWDAAMSGDRIAVETVLKVIEQRCRLLGLWGGKATMGSNQGLFVTDHRSRSSESGLCSTWLEEDPCYFLPPEVDPLRNSTTTQS